MFKKILTIFFLSLLTSCSYSQLNLNADGTYTLRRPIQVVAMMEPGLNGARNYLTLDAQKTCPEGWQNLGENIQIIDTKKFMVWKIACKRKKVSKGKEGEYP